MAYIRRDSTGNIAGVFAVPQTDATEFIAPDSPELMLYLGQRSTADDVKVILNSTDLALIRVLEDLINTLVDKGVILFTDLPAAAQDKLIHREKVRDRLNSLDDLLQDDPGIL